TIQNLLFSQIVNPFASRYQTNQKGSITFVTNTALTCNPTATSSGTACPTATGSNSNGGGQTNNNNSWTMQYVDSDGDNSTIMSSSDSLNLPNCSEITWAGLYWCASNTNGASSQPAGYANRSQVKFKVNNSAYQTLTADQTINSTTGYQSYFCFKNVTPIVQGAGIKARFTLGDMFCWTGATNLAGGWTLVVVYKNTTMTDRNLTVFDGLAVVSSGNTVTVPINGFVTPLSGPVNFELGVVALDGDRGSTGDQLSFNGVGNTYVNVNDAMHANGNSFNSTICYNGVITPFRLPNFNNTLGYDANIFVPNNNTFNFLGNAATSANIRVSTNSDIIMTRLITSAIDIYQPDLRATLNINDLNGGQVMANDILEYTIKCVNIGSDTSINTYVLDTLDIRTNLIPGTLQVLSGPNTGFKTDALADDQGEYDAATRVVKFRIGTGANGTIGGQVNNSPTGSDSTVVRFRVQVIDDCLLLNCDSTLTNLAYIYGTGNISGQLYTNNGTPNTYDANGCPTNQSSSVVFHTTGCPPADITNNGPLCAEDTLVFDAPNSSFAQYSWSGPNSFSSTLEDPSILNATVAASGSYNLLISFTGNSCTYNLTEQVTVWPIPTVTANITNVSCYNYSNGQITLTPGANTPYSYQWNTGSTSNPFTNLVDGNYSVIYTDINGCKDTSVYTVTEPPLFSVTTAITSNYNGQNVSCFGSTNGSASSTVTGGTAPFTYSWSNGASTPNLTNIGAGTYILTVTDANGCQALDTVILVNPPQLSATASITSDYNGQDVSCFGSTNGSASVAASGGTPGYSYFWTPGGSTNTTLSNIGAGTYNVTVTDLNGCTASSSVTLVNPPNLSIVVSIASSYNGQNISCFGGNNGAATVTVTGGTPAYAYLWNNGGTTQTINNLTAGTYSVTVTDVNG
ncbi:MAG: SprB repeat-containing protein, partial [Flavobacteriales bacterium]